MKTNFKLLAMAAVAMLAMNSCEKENEMNTGEQKGTPVEFEMGINSITKTVTEDNSYATTFAEGDSVGIFVFDGTSTIVTNAQYKLQDGKWVAQGSPIYAESGKTYSYYAYYPYNVEATNIESISLSVATDQTKGYNSSDALIAKTENVAGETTEVKLGYAHAFSLVQVVLSGKEASESTIVTLQNINPTASINLKTGTVGDASAPSGTVNVTMKPCTTPLTYRAIVPAQIIEANKSLLKASTPNKEYSFTYNKQVSYEQSKLRLINVTLGETTGNPISITGAQEEIKNWEASEDLGEGGTTESTNRFQIPTGTGNDTIVMAYSKDPSKVENQTGDFWFYRTDKTTKAEAEAQGTVTCTTDDTYGNVISITNLTLQTNSFYKVAAGYYLKNSGCLISKKYKLSFKVKGTSGAKVLSAIRISNSSASAVVYNKSGDPTTSVCTTTLSSDDTWEEGGTVFDFSKKSSGVGAIPGKNNTWSATTDTNDVMNIDIRIYPSTQTTVSIADVKLEEYTE